MKNYFMFVFLALTAISQTSYGDLVAHQWHPESSQSKTIKPPDFTVNMDGVIKTYIFWRWNKTTIHFDIPLTILIHGRNKKLTLEDHSFTYHDKTIAIEKIFQKGIIDEIDNSDTDNRNEYFKDKNGHRLVIYYSARYPIIAAEHLISSRCEHPAKEIRGYNFSLLKTKQGISLGESIKVVKRRLGKPRIDTNFRGYRILFYFSRPIITQVKYKTGRATAFAFQRDHIKEIWIEDWDTSPFG